MGTVLVASGTAKVHLFFESDTMKNFGVLLLTVLADVCLLLILMLNSVLIVVKLIGRLLLDDLCRVF